MGTAIEKRARLCELQGNKMTSAMMEVDGQENAAPVMNDGGAARAKKNADGTDARKNQMWVEKYRPSRLADVAAHKDIIDTIGRLTKEDKLPHLLLYGPPGTGKTSTILAVAKELYGPAFAQMTLELNASDGASIARDPAAPALVFFKKAGEPERRRRTRHQTRSTPRSLFSNLDRISSLLTSPPPPSSPPPPRRPRHRRRAAQKIAARSTTQHRPGLRGPSSVAPKPERAADVRRRRRTV